MASEEERWERLIQGLRSGEGQIVQEFCAEYAGLLHRLAEKRLPRALLRRVGPEDVVQSVCRTFLRRAQGGEFQFDDSADLWRLLCAITLTKVRNQTRFHLRQRRSLAREVSDELPDGESGPGLAPQTPGPSPAEAAAFADQFQQVLASLEEEERQVVELKLQEYTNEEVAEQLHCSERTVRRIVKRAQERFARAFEAP